MAFVALALAAVGGASVPAPAATSTCHSAAGAAACAGLRAAPFVTPAQARGAMAALWNLRERGLDTHNSPAFAPIETGSAELTDQEAALGVACGCTKFYWTQGPRKFIRATVFLPRQTRYPLYFAASVLAARGGPAPATGATSMFIVTRSSPNRPWRIADLVFDSGYLSPQPGFLPPPTDGHGYMTLSSSQASQVRRTWIPELVSYFNQIKKTGAQPAQTPFAPGPLTSQNGLEARPNGYTNGGITSHYAFRPGPFGGPWALNTGGNTGVCGDIVESASGTPAEKGHVLLQPASRHNWGPHLAPGLYRSITTLYEWSVCIFREGSKLVVGGDLSGGYPIYESGVRAG